MLCNVRYWVMPKNHKKLSSCHSANGIHCCYTHDYWLQRLKLRLMPVIQNIRCFCCCLLSFCWLVDWTLWTLCWMCWLTRADILLMIALWHCFQSQITVMDFPVFKSIQPDVSCNALLLCSSVAPLWIMMHVSWTHGRQIRAAATMIDKIVFQYWFPVCCDMIKSFNAAPEFCCIFCIGR